MLNLHLNLSGGLTGDMFIAAVLDAFPRFEARVIAAIDAFDAPYPVVCSLIACSDHDVTGHRFEIEPFDKYFGHIPLAFPQDRASWESVRERLVGAEIGAGVRVPPRFSNCWCARRRPFRASCRRGLPSRPVPGIRWRRL